MSVLIVGGGIGGLCLAVACRQRGIACEIVEREPAWTTVGAGIAFYPNGERALRRLGLADAAVSAGAVIHRVRTCDRDGNVVSEFPGERWEGIGQTFAIHRAALQRILLDAIDGTRVHLDTTVESLHDKGDAVDVKLTNGESLTAAIVVGADGLLVEVHPCPEQAMSDGDQSLTFGEFRRMMRDLQPYLELQQEARQLRPQLLAAGGAD